MLLPLFSILMQTAHLTSQSSASTLPNTQAFNVLGRQHPSSRRKNLFTKRVKSVKYWNRMAREVVETPSLGVFRKHVNVALRDMV